MRIGFHKLGYNFIRFDNDKNGMFTEVYQLMEVFRANGLNVEYVNLELPGYNNSFDMLDIIYVFNGFENSTSNLKKIRSYCKELNYILTDTRFYESAILLEEFIDNYFVQSTRKVFNKPTYNSHIHMLLLFMNGPLNYIGLRNWRLLFGGSVRDRENKISEYILRPNVDYYLKFDRINADNRIPLEEYNNKLSKYSFGIVITNDTDRLIGNITWRYFEYIANGVLTFVDRDSDPYNLLLCENDYMYVSSYLEMVAKMEELKSSHEIREMVYRNQLKFDDNVFNGSLFVKSLLGKEFINV